MEINMYACAARKYRVETTLTPQDTGASRLALGPWPFWRLLKPLSYQRNKGPRRHPQIGEVACRGFPSAEPKAALMASSESKL